MANKLHIEKWNHEQDGELSDKNMKRKLKLQGYNFIRYEFAPGTDFPDHTHAVSKKDSITSGQFQFTMFGHTVVLEPGDMIEVPANTLHNAQAIGTKTVVFYDATK